ncbi:hypothetical protein CO2235_MP10031 [Cupriavidus oxalaticus]|uniref:Uncharacterized protein n=1 Tax=Cupriavidus oxalaticus TaxID=96344 RepID=A0A375GBK3_9BURK|nr:hypothetical protein CO2235_MP10031 [Cupriavidus oxalaticus]
MSGVSVDNTNSLFRLRVNPWLTLYPLAHRLFMNISFIYEHKKSARAPPVSGTPRWRYRNGNNDFEDRHQRRRHRRTGRGHRAARVRPGRGGL